MIGLMFSTTDYESNEDQAQPLEDDAVLMGYRFCAEETIRFLIDEEHFSPDDPVIQELHRHLDHQQVKLQQLHKKDISALKDGDKDDDDNGCSTAQIQDTEQLSHHEISPENQSCSKVDSENIRHDASLPKQVNIIEKT